jgi:cytochrome c oxidase subunit 1
MAYLLWSLKYGRKVGANPWAAKGLEWEEAASPPPTFNFEEQPVVTAEAYAYTELDHDPAADPHREVRLV